MQRLEEDYPGDTAWQAFASLYMQEYEDANCRLLADSLGGQIDIASIIYGKRGIQEALWWIEQSVPALDDLRPIDCLDSPVLLKRLKTALMRMP